MAARFVGRDRARAGERAPGVARGTDAGRGAHQPWGSGGRLVGLSAVGAALFLLLHVVFVVARSWWFQDAEIEVAWFLASRRSVVAAQVTFGVAAMVLALCSPGAWRWRFAEGGSLAAGGLAAMVFMFSVIGADRLLLGSPDLWPVALGAGALLLAPAAFAGTLAGGLLRDAVGRR